MRSVKELLEVMLEHPEMFQFGLCTWSRNLYMKGLIAPNECVLLLDYIANNRPSKYSSMSAFKERGSDYYWKGSKITPRIKWIKKHINKLK